VPVLFFELQSYLPNCFKIPHFFVLTDSFYFHLIRKIKIQEITIIDNNKNMEIGEDFTKSNVSILVQFNLNGIQYILDFQTTGTYDYGAISSNLEAYNLTDDYDRLEALYDDDLPALLKKIKKMAGVQKKWSNYVSENYIPDNEIYNGMDANSEYDLIHSLPPLDKP